MKQFFALILIPIHLFSAIALSGPGEEWIKLPSLLRHFNEHRSETPGLSFVDFLDQHYGKLFDTHQNDHDHSKLPMKSSPAHGIFCTATHAGLLATPVIPYLVAPDTDFRQKLFCDPYLKSSALSADIWQPPRFC